MKTMLLAAGVAALAARSWTQPLNVSGSGATEQQAEQQVRTLCQGMWGGWRQRCEAGGGHFDDASEQACFRFVPVCSGSGRLWSCNYFASVTCVLGS